MKNSIRYYYEIEVDDITFQDNKYYFDNYILVENKKNIDIKLYEYLNQNGIPNYEIVWNKDDNYITSIERKNYILLKKNREIPISFSMLEQFYIPINKKEIIPWDELWINKVDYYEKHVYTISLKEIKESFSYFVGLTENAISFYREIKQENYLFIAHSRLKTDEDFLNPLNFAIDYRIRDVAEYTKSLFFNNKFNINDLYIYFSRNNLSENDMLLFYARLLFPSYYFDCYDDISNGKDTNQLSNVINKIDEYEEFLREMYYYIKQFTNIPKIDWIINEKV